MAVNPGSIGNQMPPQDDDLQRMIRDLRRDIRENASAKSGQAMQIGAGGITLTDGGSIFVNGGSIQLSSGDLSAGTVEAASTITAGGTITSTSGNIVAGGNLSAGGTATINGNTAVGGAITAAALGTTGDVNASGRVISSGIIRSPGTKANTVTVGYSAVYIDVNGDMGGNTSSRRYKQDIEPVTDAGTGFLGLTVYRFRYIASVEALGEAAPYEYGLMAEDVVQVAPWACFYEDDGTTVRGINYDRLIVSALTVLKDHETRIANLERDHL